MGSGKLIGIDQDADAIEAAGKRPVSYTHLDVYKRQSFTKRGMLAVTAGPYMELMTESSIRTAPVRKMEVPPRRRLT